GILLATPARNLARGEVNRYPKPNTVQAPSLRGRKGLLVVFCREGSALCSGAGGADGCSRPVGSGCVAGSLSLDRGDAVVDRSSVGCGLVTAGEAGSGRVSVGGGSVVG